MRYLFRILFSFIIFIGSINISFAASDMLESAFQWSKWDDTVVDMWNNANSVWSWIFNWGHNLWLDWFTTREPLLVKIAKFLLKITIAIWVTMFLIWWILYLLSLWDQWAMRKAMKNLIIAGAWILLALFSMAIIDLITSITSSMRI